MIHTSRMLELETGVGLEPRHCDMECGFPDGTVTTMTRACPLHFLFCMGTWKGHPGKFKVGENGLRSIGSFSIQFREATCATGFFILAGRAQ